MLRLLWLSDRMFGGTSAYTRIMAHIPMGKANRMGKQVYRGVMIYPSGEDPLGEDAVLPAYTEWRADLLVTLKEVWNFNHIHRFALNWCPIVPIDHSPVSPSVTSRLSTALKPIAISRFGQRELRQANIDSAYIPHHVFADIYRPLERKADCKRMFFFQPDEFVVGIVAMNRARKLISRQLRGYKRFLELNPDAKSRLMLWSDIRPAKTPGETPQGVADVGVNLLPEIMELGLGEAVRWPDSALIREGLPDWAGDDYRGGWDMVKLYNSFDCLMLCSGGEGFGLPLLEAQSCGVPVVTTDYAAGPELVGSGYTVKADDYVILNTPGTRYALASVDGMAEALSKVYNADRGRLARRARRFAERYDWSRVYEQYWRPFLCEIEAELKPLITRAGVGTWA